MGVSATKFARGAWANNVGTGLALANVAVMFQGANLIKSNIIENLPEIETSLTQAFKSLAEGVALAMHPHFTLVPALLTMMPEAGKEVAEMNGSTEYRV